VLTGTAAALLGARQSQLDTTGFTPARWPGDTLLLDEEDARVFLAFFRLACMTLKLNRGGLDNPGARFEEGQEHREHNHGHG
jgi:hypothetical protein